MKVSVIVPALDEEAAIASTLARAREGAGAYDIELIVVDGGSKDATAARAAELADKVLCAPKGRGRQMNVGAWAASGDVLLFLHADTILPANFPEIIARAVSDPDIAWGRFDVALTGRGVLLRLVERLINLRSRVSRIATGDQAIFVRSRVFRCAGGYPDIPLFEDVVLSRTLKRLGKSACLRERVVTSARRWQKDGVVRTILRMWILRALFWFGVPPAKLCAFYRDVR